MHFRCKTPALKAKKPVDNGRKPTSVKDEDGASVQDSDSDLLGAVEALIPVPVLITNSPLRGNCLQSLNEVPDSYDIDLESTLKTIKFELPTSDTSLSLPPTNFVIVPQSATDEIDNDQNQSFTFYLKNINRR